MLKTYQKYIISNFFSKFFILTIIFFLLLIVLISLEEISFTKKLNVNFLFPYFLTLLNIPITLFEIFPFIFLITTQLVYYDFFKKNELQLFKSNGITNLSLIKIIFLISIGIGIFNTIVFYNIASNLKFYYSNLKNDLSSDNKYLAMVTKSGLWIKDEVDNKKLIVRSKFIKDNFIFENIISEFDKNFNLIRVIQSNKININSNYWIIFDPIVTENNSSISLSKPIIVKTNFDFKKINNIFSNVSTLDIFKLYRLKEDYDKIGYSTNELFIHFLKILTTPILYGILSLLGCILMQSLSNRTNIFYFISIGFLSSVIIYYIMFFFSSLANNGKIPPEMSVIFPILILTIISTIGLIDANDK